MIVYLADKKRFRDDVFSNRIEERILEAFQKTHNTSVGASEIKAWKNSLGFMDRVLEDESIPSTAGVAIEFGIPNSGKRIDFIISGENEHKERTAVIVELKQWEEAKTTSKDAIVETFLNGAQRELSHPSYQAWSYAALIEDYNEAVRVQPIRLKPCAYLHNCHSEAAIRHPHYQPHLERAPAFLKDDAGKLRHFIRTHVRFGDHGQAIYEINNGKISPSKNLADSMVSLLKGNKEFVLIDDQKLVYETALALSERASSGEKQVLIVEGGPGTGKSVVAINLLVELTARKKVVKYVSKNSAPRAVYESKLTGSFTKSHISNLFTGSGAFVGCELNCFDALVVDEAHRLKAKSGLFGNLGENQIKELIHSSRLSVFFIDGAQRVTLSDIGDIEAIREWAKRQKAKLTELKLESQFRCNGSDGYLAWVDQLLGIRETANETLEGIDYEFKVCDSANELHKLIRERSAINNKSRMVAGYCWNWVSKKNPDALDIVLKQEAFAAQWNLNKDGSLWIVQPGAVEQVGCIHTCQGLELEYVGVLMGPDLVIRDGQWVDYPNYRARTDASLKGYKKLLLNDSLTATQKAKEIIRNTYRTLMTRGQKGCFIYSVDPETNAFLKNAANKGLLTQPQYPDNTHAPYPFRILLESEAKPYLNCIPCYLTLKAAAGAFSDTHDIEPPVWAELPANKKVKHGDFLVQVTGESMNRTIPNGAWGLFRPNVLGSRQDKIVLVEHHGISDPDNGGSYTVKRYHSKKTQSAEGWHHTRISLYPDSTDSSYQPIELAEETIEELRILGEFIWCMPEN